MPSPQLLEALERFHPGATARWLELIEAEQEHRHLERTTALNADKRADHGLTYAFVVSILAIGGAVYLGVIGHPIEGGVVGTAGLAQVIGAFIYGSQRLNVPSQLGSAAREKSS